MHFSYDLSHRCGHPLYKRVNMHDSIFFSKKKKGQVRSREYSPHSSNQLSILKKRKDKLGVESILLTQSINFRLKKKKGQVRSREYSPHSINQLSILHTQPQHQVNLLRSYWIMNFLLAPKRSEIFCVTSRSFHSCFISTLI